METPPIDRYGNGKVVGFQFSTRSESISEAGGGWVQWDPGGMSEVDNLYNLAEDCGEITEADIREAD